jgi:cytochrome c
LTDIKFIGRISGTLITVYCDFSLWPGVAMIRLRPLAHAVISVLALHSAGAAADDFTDPGRKIFERHCQTCHGGTAPPDSKIGPSLAGIIGRKAGSENSGVHSRAALESDTVWTRSSLRRYISEPVREMPGTIMSDQALNSRELDDLLNFLETLR